MASFKSCSLSQTQKGGQDWEKQRGWEIGRRPGLLPVAGGERLWSSRLPVREGEGRSSGEPRPAPGLPPRGHLPEAELTAT